MATKAHIDHIGNGLVNERDLARMLRVSVSLVQKWRSRGEGPTPIRIGRSVRYSEAAIAKFIDKCAMRAVA